MKLYSPMNGKIKKLKDVSDPAFAQGMMGQGVAIVSEDGLVCAPCDGEIAVLFDTKHAIGLMTEDGIELLIHYGIDTVELKGAPFKTFVKQGDKVKAGDKLIKANNAAIEKAGKSIETPFLVTSGQKVKVKAKGSVKVGDELMTVK